MAELAEDDGPFLAAIAAVPADRWSELWAALDAVDGGAEYAQWAGGQVVGTVAIDGVDQPMRQMPYPQYSEAVERLRGAIGACGLIVPFDWMGWAGIERYRDPASLAAAPPADAVRLIVAILRGERFSDGSIEGALERGLLQAAVARLRADHG